MNIRERTTTQALQSHFRYVNDGCSQDCSALTCSTTPSFTKQQSLCFRLLSHHRHRPAFPISHSTYNQLKHLYQHLKSEPPLKIIIRMDRQLAIWELQQPGATRRSLTWAYSNRLVVAGTDPRWNNLRLRLDDLLDHLIEHDHMRQNAQDHPYKHPTEVNQVYLMWEYVGQLLVSDAMPPCSSVETQLRAPGPLLPIFSSSRC